MTEEGAIKKYFPEGAVNCKLKGGGNGKPQYDYEKKVMAEMLKDYANEKVKEFARFYDETEVTNDGRTAQEAILQMNTAKNIINL